MAKKGAAAETAIMSHFMDVIAPSAIHFYPRHIEIGDSVARVLVIANYPQKAGRAWLSQVATLPGVTLSVHAQPTDAYELIKNIEVSLGELETKLHSGKPIEQERAKTQKKGAKFLFSKLDLEQQKVFFVTTILYVTASDLEQLNQRTRDVESKLAGPGMRGRTPTFYQEEGLNALLPLGKPEPFIADFGKRNMPAETIAAAYPFVYAGLNDGDGLLMGKDVSGGIVLVDFWQREGSRTNSNCTIMGRPGVGKSTVVKKHMINEFARGTKIIVIDPEREYRDLCKNVGGDWIDCGGGTKGRINPLQIRNVPMDEEDEEESLYGQTGSKSPLALHFQTLRTFFRMYLKDATKVQLGLLEVALEEVYRARGIVWDTDVSLLQNGDYPHILELYRHIEQCAERSEGDKDREAWRELTLLLRPAAVGADRALWSGETTIEAASDFICLDIHQLLEADEEIRKAQFFNVLSWAWNKIAEDRSQQVILYVDEAYLLVDPQTPQALQFLRNTSKRIRKYGGGLWVITHNMVDFMDPAVQRYGQALIDNPVYKLIMGQGDKDIEALTKLMTLSEREMLTLAEGKRGEALLVAGNRRLHIQIEITPFEMELLGRAGGR